jgi:glycerophosphoryl diester phosphodiesterase
VPEQMKRPLVLGHRGARASHHIPENTLASFELCLQHGCDGFEFDVRRSADGQAVVCHGPIVRGAKIAATPSTVLGLPTLDAVLRSFAPRAFLDIELKVSGLEQETIVLLRKHPPQRGYVVSSFLPQVLVALHDIDATIPLGFICEKPAKEDLWQKLPVDWVMPHVELAGQAFVARLPEAGKKVMVWTVNDEDQMRRFGDCGVDAIISDETELAARVLPIA